MSGRYIAKTLPWGHLWTGGINNNVHIKTPIIFFLFLSIVYSVQFLLCPQSTIYPRECKKTGQNAASTPQLTGSNSEHWQKFLSMRSRQASGKGKDKNHLENDFCHSLKKKISLSVEGSFINFNTIVSIIINSRYLLSTYWILGFSNHQVKELIISEIN